MARKRARRDGWPRAICDYLSGMTDRYAIQEHHGSPGISDAWGVYPNGAENS